jgi:tRNA threonylcarbamoyladenosine biosynthesis protein TsaE
MDPRQLPDPAGFARAVTTDGPERTRALGADLARVLAPGQALLLHGPLGAGKTCLVQGLCRGLGLPDEVTSPTFSLVHRYRGAVTVDHLDFYRLEPGDDLGDVGVLEILDDLADRRTLVVAEWPRLLAPLVPERLELLALPGEAPQARRWLVRGVPGLPAAVAALFPEEVPPC